jgi:hypothetical protein
MKENIFTKVIVVSIGFSLVFFTMDSLNTTNNSSVRSGWEQSTERLLRQQNEAYYDGISSSYKRLTNDLTNYRILTNRIVSNLEDRISELENRVDSITNSLGGYEND